MMKTVILRNAKRLGQSQEGTALVVALVSTLVVSVLVGASLSRCLYTWNEMGRSYHRDAALHTAESGAEMAIFALNHPNAQEDYGESGFESVLRSLAAEGDVTSLSGGLADASGQTLGDYSVSVQTDPSNPQRAFVTSTATVPPESANSNSRVSRTVRVVIQRRGFPPGTFGNAIYTPTWIDTNGVTEIHGNTVSGNYIRTVGNDDPHDRVTPYEYQYWDEDTQSVQTAYGTCDEGRNTDADPDNDVVLPFDEFILDQFKQISIEQGYCFDYEPSQAELPTSFYQPDGVTPNVVFITSSIHICGNYTIGGLFFVVGDILSEEEDAEFGGNDLIEGIVYTTGLFRTHGGGNMSININGGVFCGVANLQGNATVQYNWQYFEALENLALSSNKYRFVSWQEIDGA